MQLIPKDQYFVHNTNSLKLPEGTAHIVSGGSQNDQNGDYLEFILGSFAADPGRTFKAYFVIDNSKRPATHVVNYITVTNVVMNPYVAASKRMYAALPKQIADSIDIYELYDKVADIGYTDDADFVCNYTASSTLFHVYNGVRVGDAYNIVDSANDGELEGDPGILLDEIAPLVGGMDYLKKCATAHNADIKIVAVELLQRYILKKVNVI